MYTVYTVYFLFLYHTVKYKRELSVLLDEPRVERE